MNNGSRSGSFAGDPIMKLPLGTTTICGHTRQSLNHSVLPAPGVRQRVSLPTVVSTPLHVVAAGGVFSIASLAAPAFAGVMQLRRNQVHPARSQSSSNFAFTQVSD